MKDLTPTFKAHIRQGVTTLTSCMEIVRSDGKSYRFTDHDMPVTVANALFVPYSSFSRTSVTTSIDLEVDQMEVRGALNSKHVARDDVASGLFDFAKVKVFVVNYEAPDSGGATLRTGWLGEVTMNEDGTYSAELRGLSQVYSYRIGEAYTPECRADLGDHRCKLPLAPPQWVANNAYAKGDVVVGNINAASSYLNLGIQNAGFDDDGFVDYTRDITGWTTYGDPRGRWSLRSSAWYGTTPFAGISAFGTDDGAAQDPANHTVSDIGMYQDVELTGQGADADALDTGLCRLYSSVQTASVNGREATARYRVYALDVNRTQIGAAALYDSGDMHTAEDRWFQTTVSDVLLPVGIRYLRFDLLAHKRARYEEGAAFDSLTAAINYPGGTLGSSQQNGSIAFQALNAGISGASEPSWDNLLGSNTTDNDITWVAVKSWKTVSFVDGIDGTGKAITPTYLFDAVGYYDGGLLTWETGLNAGRSQEIKTWTGGQITLFERPFHIPQEGDRFVIRPGCDKTRTTCSTKFANILNFRGEPDVPGQDTYYSTPNAPST